MQRKSEKYVDLLQADPGRAAISELFCYIARARGSMIVLGEVTI